MTQEPEPLNRESQEPTTPSPDQTSAQEDFELAQPPLTDEQIEEMNRRRYPRSLSPEEIESINDARARGIHHGIS